MSFFSDSPYGGLDREDLQREYLWNLLLPIPLDLSIQIPSGLSFPEPGLISTYAVSVDFGMAKSDTLVEMDFGNRKNRSLGRIDVSDITIRLLETEYSFVMLYFRTWWSTVVNRQGVYNPQNKYKRSVLLVLLTTELTPCMVYRLDGCFPRALPQYTLDYRNNTVLAVEAKLSADMADIFTMYPNTDSEEPLYRTTARAALNAPRITQPITAISPGSSAVLPSPASVNAPVLQGATAPSTVASPAYSPSEVAARATEGVGVKVPEDVTNLSGVRGPLPLPKETPTPGLAGGTSGFNIPVTIPPTELGVGEKTALAISPVTKSVSNLELVEANIITGGELDIVGNILKGAQPLLDMVGNAVNGITSTMGRDTPKVGGNSLVGAGAAGASNSIVPQLLKVIP